MKVLLAPDSFKGSFTSFQVSEHLKEGIVRVYPEAEFKALSIADGGEGTVESIVSAVGGRYETVRVRGPLGEEVSARYGILKDNTAVIELAEASGLALVPADRRNPMLTSTYGFGQLIRDALDKGCRKMVLGIGGSATNDGGAGMAQALGVRFLDKAENEIRVAGGNLDRIETIDMQGLDPRLAEAEILVACDVENPLCGEKGAAGVYGPQKGATPEMVGQLDEHLKHLAGKIKISCQKDVLNVPGAGAAGGAGGGLMAFLNARLVKGIDFILDLIEMDRHVAWADMVITGEGRMDGQSVYGKVPVGVAGRAKKLGRPVFAICGFIGEGAEKVHGCGIDAILSSIVAPVSLEQAIQESPKRLADAGERLFRIIKAVKSMG